MQNTTIRTMVDSSALETAITELREIRESLPEVPAETLDGIVDMLLQGLAFTQKPHSASRTLELCVVIVIPDSHDERMAALRAGHI